MYSPRARALLRSARHSNIPWPTMARQRDRHHARPRGRPTRGSRGPHHPAQSPQGRPPAGGQSPGPRPGPNHLGAGGLPPQTGHALPDPVDQAPLAVGGDRALDLGHPHCPHTSRGRSRHADRPPPPGRNTPSPADTTPSAGCSAAWTLAQHYNTLFPPMFKRNTKNAHSSAKSLPRQQKTASFSSKPPGLQVTTQARRCKRTHTRTQHTGPQPQPLPYNPARAPPSPLPNRWSTHAHHCVQPRGPRHRPPPAAQSTTHARHRPSRRTPLTAPHTWQPTHTRRGEPHAARHIRPAQ